MQGRRDLEKMWIGISSAERSEFFGQSTVNKLAGVPGLLVEHRMFFEKGISVFILGVLIAHCAISIFT